MKEIAQSFLGPRAERSGREEAQGAQRPLVGLPT
jgi:hypothetical protein